MARLNVEKLDDDRILKLIAMVGDDERAVGRVVLFWKVAQKYWKNNRQLIPIEVFQRRDWQLLVEVGLAEIRDNGVYAKGSETSFDWLVQCKEAGERGGKKSAKLRSRVSKGTPRVSNLLTPSLSLINKKNIYKKKEPVKDWPTDHRFAKVFSNLNRIPAYREIFDLPNDEDTIDRYLENYSLSIRDMEQISFQLAEYTNDPNIKIARPRGKLSTFVQNYAKQKPSNQKNQYPLFTGDI